MATATKSYYDSESGITFYWEITSYDGSIGENGNTIKFPKVRVKLNWPTDAYSSTKWRINSNGVNVSGMLGSTEIAYTGTTKASSWANRNAWLDITSLMAQSEEAVDISDFFNSSNKNAASVSVSWVLEDLDLGCELQYDGISFSTVPSYKIAPSTVTLNAPPTFDNSLMRFSTPYYYAGLTTASVDISNLSAKYRGDITKAALKIGNNESEPITTDGTLSMLLEEVGTNLPVSITVTDSRGQTRTKSLAPINVLSYSAPSVSLSVERTDNTGEPNDEGIYGTLTALFTFTDEIAYLVEPTVSGAAGVTWYKTRDASTGVLSNPVDWNDPSGIFSGKTLYCLAGTFLPNETYTLSVIPNDSVGAGTEQHIALPTAFYTVDYKAGGHGIAFGQPATQDGFFCNMESHFTDGNDVMRALFDFCYPVGSYYHTSDENFNPNTSWGGTWSLLGEGQVLLSGSKSGSYKVGTAYGGNTKSYTPAGSVGSHTLTVDQIPSHTHGNPSDGEFIINKSVTTGYAFSFAAGSYYRDSAKATAARGGGKGHNHGFTGTQATINVMQKSTAVYIWHRTA